MTFKYPSYANLVLDWPAEHVLRITIARGKVNAMDYQLHHDISQIWRLVDRDPEVAAVIVTGAGDYFSAGGDFETDSRIPDDPELAIDMSKDARELVENMIACSKPIISAINGPAAGAGLAVALMADITVVARTAKLVDGHVRLGVAAGDHAALIWPLLCGLAKAKYYLLTGKPIFGEEAERIGLVSLCVEKDELQAAAVEIATTLAEGAQTAIRWTKMSINGWLRQAWPIFEASLAYEMVGYTGPEMREGINSHVAKRPPKFNPRSRL